MRIVSLCLTSAAGLVSAATLALVIGAFLDPTRSSYAMIGALVWTTWGPHLLLLALLAAVVSGLFLRARGRALARLALALSAAAMTGAGYIVVSIILATQAAGGSVDPVAALLLGKMTVPEPDTIETISAPNGPDLKAAIFRPAQASSPLPIIVYIHGGGFMAGTITETAADLRWFADHGYFVVSIDYRVFGPNYPTWDKAPADVACGLAWVGQNAARLGGDSARIALLGDSAGGNLAINLAYAASQGKASSPCGTVPVPRAVAVQYPAVDPLSIYERGFPIPGFEPAMLMAGYIGGTPAEYPDRLATVSSATYIHTNAPDTLIVEPESDSLVVSDGVYAFAEKAKAAGIAITVARIPFANHIYNQIAANSLGNQAGRTIRLHYLEARMK